MSTLGKPRYFYRRRRFVLSRAESTVADKILTLLIFVLVILPSCATRSCVPRWLWPARLIERDQLSVLRHSAVELRKQTLVGRTRVRKFFVAVSIRPLDHFLPPAHLHGNPLRALIGLTLKSFSNAG